MKPQRIAEYRSPYGALCQARAVAIDEAIHDIELELGLPRLVGVHRATLTWVLECFAERWPKERAAP